MRYRLMIHQASSDRLVDISRSVRSSRNIFPYIVKRIATPIAEETIDFPWL